MDATIKNITNDSITFSAPNAWSGLSWTYFLEPSQTYTAFFKTDLTTDQVRAYVRFPNGNLSSTIGGSHSFSFTTDSTGKIQFTMESVTGTEEDIVVSDIQIEKGSTATSYEPYQSSTVTTGKLPLTSDMIEQGSFYDSFELNTQTYEYIKVPSTADDFYVDRIRSK